MNTTNLKHVSVSVALALLGGLTTQAATLSIVSDADSYIRASQGNQGTNSNMIVGDVSDTDVLRGVLNFDLSDPLLTGATINSAALTMTLTRNDINSNGAGNQIIEVHELTATFTQLGVTWTSRDGTNDWTTAGGDFNLGLASSLVADPADSLSGVQHSFTGLETEVAGAVGGDLGLLLKLESETGGRSVFFYSTEGGTAPVLEIDFTPVPEPGSFALLGLGGMALLLRRRK